MKNGMIDEVGMFCEKTAQSDSSVILGGYQDERLCDYSKQYCRFAERMA